MAGRIPTHLIEQIRNASDIVEVIGAAIPLKRAGANWIALCPFHREKTPSFNVNPQRQIFHCFGCHKGGDVFAFLQEYESVDFLEAVRRLADRAGISLQRYESDGPAGGREIKETLRQIHEAAAQRWHLTLTRDPGAAAARDYLARRKVPDEAVRDFRLGFAPDRWDDTVQWARAQDYDLAIVQQAGLILRREDESGFYDRFRGRLIFPICDEQGRVIAFSGRLLDPDAKAAKYVNSPESPIFLKRKVFFGLDKARRAILDAQFAVVCEGQLDLIAVHMAGIRNVVAPQGTAFTADHALLLKRYASEVVLCFDSDTAGQSAAVRALDDLLASGLAIRVATLPAPHDPDSFIREFGAPAFRQRIDQAAGFFDFYLDHLSQIHDHASDRGRLAILRAMGEAARKTQNAVILDRCAQTTAVRLGVSAAAVRSEFLRTPTARPRTPATQPSPAPDTDRPSPTEFWLLKLAFQPEVSLAWLMAHLDPAWLRNGTARLILDRCRQMIEENRWTQPAALLTELSDPAARQLLSECLADTRSVPAPVRQIEDLVTRLRNQSIDHQLMLLAQQVGQPHLSDLERARILQEQQALRRQKQAPLSPPLAAADS